jgi:hypothetical protein
VSGGVTAQQAQTKKRMPPLLPEQRHLQNEKKFNFIDAPPGSHELGGAVCISCN